MNSLQRFTPHAYEDAKRLQRERAQALLERALHGDPAARRSCVAQLSVSSLDGLLGSVVEQATAATLTEAQLLYLLRSSPRHKTLVTAARQGLRTCCVLSSRQRRTRLPIDKIRLPRLALTSDVSYLMLIERHHGTVSHPLAFATKE